MICIFNNLCSPTDPSIVYQYCLLAGEVFIVLVGNAKVIFTWNHFKTRTFNL